MAGLMQWFQVTCPKCTGALQVRLPEGVTSVQCSQCKAVFAVQVQPVALAPPGGPVPPLKRSRKRKKDTPGVNGVNDDPNGPPRTLSAYNVFMKSEVAKVKNEHPQLPHREAFKLAAERWQASPMNPQNGGERFPLKVGGDGTGAGAFSPGQLEGGAGGFAAGGGDEDDGEDGEEEEEDEEDGVGGEGVGVGEPVGAA